MFGFFRSAKKYKDINQNEMNDVLKNDKNALIIDVRTKSEFVSGHIPKAINIDIMSPEFSTKIKNLDADKTYLVYCRSGNRSASACSNMAKLGFKNLYNLSGGISSYNGKTVR
jgi:phage shock protein E